MGIVMWLAPLFFFLAIPILFGKFVFWLTRGISKAWKEGQTLKNNN